MMRVVFCKIKHIPVLLRIKLNLKGLCCVTLGFTILKKIAILENISRATLEYNQNTDLCSDSKYIGA